jgi:hypothetical protein
VLLSLFRAREREAKKRAREREEKRAQKSEKRRAQKKKRAFALETGFQSPNPLGRKKSKGLE